LFAYVLSAVALLVQGPSRVLGFDKNNISMTLTGFIVLGAMEAFIFVPLMPILIEALVKDQSEAAKAKKTGTKQILSEEALSDKASSLF
jgi:hypothetical protein